MLARVQKGFPYRGGARNATPSEVGLCVTCLSLLTGMRNMRKKYEKIQKIQTS